MLCSCRTASRIVKRSIPFHNALSTTSKSVQEGKPRRRERRKTNEDILDRQDDNTGTESTKSTILPDDRGTLDTKASKAGRKKTTMIELPPRIKPASSKHCDLPSFLKYTAATSMDPLSTVYKGTLYEYRVAEALKAYNFTLNRVGRSNDRGTDLLGHWELPGQNKRRPLNLPVIVQCKASRPQPSMVRELDGAFAGAVAGWRGEGVMGCLVAAGESTKGIIEALQTSCWPMGIMHITEEGIMKQFLWNEAAARVGLEGLGVAVKHADVGNAEGMKTSIALTWMGEPWQKISAAETGEGVICIDVM